MRAVRISSIFQAPLPQVWGLMKLSSTLVFVTKGWTTFTAADTFPTEWRVGETIKTNVIQFGLGKGSPYEFTFTEINEATHELRTREHGGPVKEWLHTMRVEWVDDRTCRYTDEVDVDAGWLTPVMECYVALYYRYRHWRWKLLLKQQ